MLTDPPHTILMFASHHLPPSTHPPHSLFTHPQANHRPWRIYRWGITLLLLAFFVTFFAGVQRYFRGSAINTILIIIYADFNLLLVGGG